MKNIRYVLLTAAKNEEKYIENTIISVISQTIQPLEWIIVSDASTDRTDEIIEKYSQQFNFIKLVRKMANKKRNFGAQAEALNWAYNHITVSLYDFIGCLDADITMDENYYEKVLVNMILKSDIGIAGGFIYEQKDEQFISRKYNSTRSVAGAIQLFNRLCYEAIGGFLPLKYGGLDTYAEISARSQGWQVVAFERIPVYHHRKTGGATNIFHAKFSNGRMDYSLGYHPIYEVLKCLRRIKENPPVIGFFLRLFGYFSSYLIHEKRSVSKNFIIYLRTEQLDSIKP